METRNVCRFLIIIFTCLSVLFFALYSREFDKKTTLSDEFAEETVDNLRQNGIDITNDVIKMKTPPIDIYTISYSDILSHNRLVSDTLIKNAYNSSVTTADFDVPNGSSIGVYDKNDASRELGRVVLYDDMTFKFSSSGVNINGISPMLNGETADIDGNNLRTVEAISDKLTMSDIIDYEISGSSVDDDFEIITVIQMLDGYKIDGAYINFVFDEQQLIMAGGKWITGDPKKQYHEPVLDGINVLYKLNFDNVAQIISEELIYLYKTTENNNYYLIPAWEISYTDKSGNALVEHFDAL